MSSYDLKFKMSNSNITYDSYVKIYIFFKDRTS